LAENRLMMKESFLASGIKVKTTVFAVSTKRDAKILKK